MAAAACASHSFKIQSLTTAVENEQTETVISQKQVQELDRAVDALQHADQFVMVDPDNSDRHKADDICRICRPLR
jgi:hypothetical protein